MHDSDARRNFGPLLIGGLIIFIGGFYFLRVTLGWEIGELSWDRIWPFLIIAAGITILFGGTGRRHGNDSRPQ
jgi:hypothetical protein